MSEYKTIIYEPRPVTKIIHNEPEINNVIGAEFQDEFLDAAKRFEKDKANPWNVEPKRQGDREVL